MIAGFSFLKENNNNNLQKILAGLNHVHDGSTRCKKKPSYSTMTIFPPTWPSTTTQEDIHLYQSSSHRKLFGNRTLSPEYKRINSDENNHANQKSPPTMLS
jgi:hypothetical protein